MPQLEMVRANYSRRQEIQTEIRSIAEKATEEQRDYTDDEKTVIEERKAELEQVDGRISSGIEMELRTQQINEGVGGLLGQMMDSNKGELVDTRSMSEKFTDTDDYRAYVAAGLRGEYALDFPDLESRAVTTTTTGLTSGGAFAPREHLDRFGQDFLDRKTFLAELLPHISVSNGIVEYVQDKTPLADLADKPAETTESTGAKPQAGITMALVTESPATIAAWVNITRQVAADAVQVMGYIETRLRYALRRRLDAEVISGNGTPPNLLGLTGRTGIVTYAPGSAEARYISIRHAIRLMEDVESVPEIIVLNPADAELFDLTQSTTAGLHSVMTLAGPGAPTAWGLTQVHSTAIAAGTALLIDPLAVAVLDRMGATAFLTDSHASNFINNILTLLLELRAGLAVWYPAGIAKITFNGTA